MRGRKRLKVCSFGEMDDDPAAILKLASVELRDAVRDRDAIGIRQAAECAHLALSSAVERAVRRTFRKASEEREAVAFIARRRDSPDLPEKFERLQARLHEKCFHLARCGSPLSVGQAIGEARGVVDEILRYRPRRLRRRAEGEGPGGHDDGRTRVRRR